MARDTAEVLVASVTVVFSAREPHAAGPTELAGALLEADAVSTVRIDRHGRLSTVRVDAVGDSYAQAARDAADLVEAVADDVGVRADVISVGLMTDDWRVEVYRAGAQLDEPVWGGRARRAAG
jgi:hypothetical protein